MAKRLTGLTGGWHLSNERPASDFKFPISSTIWLLAMQIA